jgi:Protein of unknown function (DUF4058)
MPIHDWSRVDANVYHHFHQQWTIAISNALNAGVLPAGYSALVEQHSGGPVPDVLAVQRQIRNGPGEPTGGLLLTTPPKVRHVFQSKQDVLAARGNRVVIRHRLGEVVCVIEVVSPGNKGSKAAFRAFISKMIEFLQNGVNLLIIDLFPPTPRDPHGIHRAVWDEYEEQPFELPADRPLTLAAYVAPDLLVGTFATAYVEQVRVGDVLPDMPAYLDRTGHVPVPLESTYQVAWANCPADMRELVETGKLPGE